MTHALVVGGTGMLRPVSLFLAEKFDKVSVIAHSDRLNLLESESKKINPINADYKNIGALDSALKKATAKFGKFDVAVVWVHLKESPEAPYVVAKYVWGRYIHLLPSWTANPDAEIQKANNERRLQFSALQNLKQYQEVVLGWQPTKPTKWLTPELIVDGTLHVIEKPALLRHTIGVVEPWSGKPAR